MSTPPTLVASYCFPPYIDTSAVVAAKRVRQFGEKVDVICNAMDTIRRIDPSLTGIAGDLVNRFAALPTPSAFSSWQSITAYTAHGMRTAERWQREQGEPYRKMYSRAQFIASHFLAGRFKALNPDVEWVAEFSDPLSHDVLGQVRTAPMANDGLARVLAAQVGRAGFNVPEVGNANEWAEVVALSLADRIIFTNELQRDFMLSQLHDQRLAERAAAHAEVSPHPTLPREFYSMVESDYRVEQGVVNIGYFGNFYANRGVGRLLDALELLAPDDRERLRLHVFTSATSGEDLTAVVDDRKLDKCVLVHPYAEFLEFLNLADKMDLLLVNDAVTPPNGTVNPFLPSKWSDYKGSTTPVWAVIEEGSSLDAQPEGSIAVRTPVEHLTAYAQTLQRLARHGVPQTAPKHFDA